MWQKKVTIAIHVAATDACINVSNNNISLSFQVQLKR